MKEGDVKSVIKTLYTFNTPYNADSVEWCPHVPFQNHFVCANYQLCEESLKPDRKRIGNILLFSIRCSNALILHQTLNTAAVLDQKWCPNQINGFSILGVVNAEKIIQIYKLDPSNCKLDLVTSFKIESDYEILMLSLDFNTGKYSSQNPRIICSDSKGNWYQFLYCNDKLVLLNSSHCHEYEAWIAAYYYWDCNIFFTGGDDSILFKFDLRAGAEPVLKNNVHDAGVTSIHSNAEREFILITGSYDEYVRLWDIRNMKTPLASLNMPGPLWRLKWDPFSHQYVLAACMLGGAHIIKICESHTLEITASYNEHKSITYGVDWCYLKPCNVEEFGCGNIIATCSFYDNLLCVSQYMS